MIKSHKGSLTVEAVLILPIFMAVILFISYFIKAHYVQDVVQDALTEAVMEVSSFSYPYYLSGALEFKSEVHQTTKERIEVLCGNYDDIYHLIDSLKGFQKPGSDKNVYSRNGKVEDVVPQKMLQLIRLYTVDKGIGYAEDSIAKALILGIMGNALSDEGKSVIDRMDALGIVDGLDGFDFTGSVFYGENDVIDIQVRYKIKQVDPFGLIKGVTFKNRVVCRAWMGGVDIDEDGCYKRVTIPPDIIFKEESQPQDENRSFQTCYIIQDSQTSEKYHLMDCPNLRVRGDPQKSKTVIPIQVPFVRENGVWKPEGSIDYQGRVYDFCGNCQAGIIRMKD